MEEIIQEYQNHINFIEKKLRSCFETPVFSVYTELVDDFFEIIHNKYNNLYFTLLCTYKDFLFELFDKYKSPSVLREWYKNFNFWVAFKQEHIKHDRPELSEKKRQRYDEDTEEFGEYVKSQNPFSPSSVFDSTKSFYENSWYPFGSNRSKSQSPLPPPPPVTAFPKTPPPPPLPPPPPSTPPGLFETYKPTEEISEQLWGPIKKETNPLPDVALKSKRDIVYKPPVLVKLTNEFIKKLILTKKYPPSLDFLASSQDTLSLSDTSSLSEKKNSKYAFSDSDSDSDYPPLEYINEINEKETTQFVPVSPPTPPQENEAETCRQQ